MRSEFSTRRVNRLGDRHGLLNRWGNKMPAGRDRRPPPSDILRLGLEPCPTPGSDEDAINESDSSDSPQASS